MLFQRLAIALLCGFVLASTCSAAVDEENLDEFGTGIIHDYGNMEESERIEWVWIKPGLTLHECRFETAPVRNITSYDDAAMEDMLDTGLDRTLTRVGSNQAGAPLLHVDSAIYWAERSSNQKVWLPFGGHLAQAGVGIELVFKDSTGAVVAKIRHSGRQGDTLKTAAEELVDDIRRFVHEN